MLEFIRTENGDLIEHEPELRMHGQPRLYVCECVNCGKQYRFGLQAKLEKKVCSCQPKQKKEVITLTVDDETRTITEWLERDPTISINGVKTRWYARKQGRTAFTDFEVLYGKRGGVRRVNIPLASDNTESWKEVFTREFNKFAGQVPLLQAIYYAIDVARQEPDFYTEEPKGLFSVKGLMFTSDGMKLPELLPLLDNDIEALKTHLRDNEGLNDTQISALFNLGD